LRPKTKSQRAKKNIHEETELNSLIEPVEDLQAPGDASSPPERKYGIALQNTSFKYFKSVWAVFAFLDPDMVPELNPDPEWVIN
jgi:hypothetical protein